MNVLAHLKERHVQVERYPSLSWDDEVASFPLWNLSGQRVGYQQYRPHASKEAHNDPKSGRYYTYRSRTTGHPGNRETTSISVFGLETFSSQYKTDILFITEGIFDIVRIHNLNLTGIATLSNDPKFLLSWIRTLPNYRIAILDDDSAGAKLAKAAHRSIVCLGKKDLGDMTNEEVYNLVKDFVNE